MDTITAAAAATVRTLATLVFTSLSVVTVRAFESTAGLKGVRAAVLAGGGVFHGRAADGGIVFRGTGALAKSFSEMGYDVHIEVVTDRREAAVLPRYARRARQATSVNCYRIYRNRDIEIRD